MRVEKLCDRTMVDGRRTEGALLDLLDKGWFETTANWPGRVTESRIGRGQGDCLDARRLRSGRDLSSTSQSPDHPTSWGGNAVLLKREKMAVQSAPSPSSGASSEIRAVEQLNLGPITKKEESLESCSSSMLHSSTSAISLVDVNLRHDVGRTDLETPRSWVSATSSCTLPQSIADVESMSQLEVQVLMEEVLELQKQAERSYSIAQMRLRDMQLPGTPSPRLFAGARNSASSCLFRVMSRVMSLLSWSYYFSSIFVFILWDICRVFCLLLEAMVCQFYLYKPGGLQVLN